jgi:phage N-6-adenine-methyltransferase
MSLDPDVRSLNRRILTETGGHPPGTIGAYLAQRDDWETPPELYAAEHARHRFTLDPCANTLNCVSAWYFDKEQNGLKMRWLDVHGQPARVWLHPPHSEPALWSRKAVTESNRGVFVRAILPAMTGAGWWHEFVMPFADDVTFLRGTPAFRLHKMRMESTHGPSRHAVGEPNRPLPTGGFALVTWAMRIRR